jgi:hypothetical protein
LDVFSGVFLLPEPACGDDGHYESFLTVYGKGSPAVVTHMSVNQKKKFCYLMPHNGM